MSTTSTPSVADREINEVNEYRPLSFPAVCAAVFGVLSAVAVLNSLFWWLPLLAVLLAAWAWIDIARRQPQPTGSKLAVTGLVLGLTLGSVGPARHVTERQILAGEARQHAEAWLEWVKQGELRTAHQFHLPHPRRAPSAANMVEQYTNDRIQRKEFDRFRSTEPLKTLIELGPAAELRYKSLEVQDFSAESASFILRYTAVWREQDRLRELPVRIVMRHDSGTGLPRAFWYVESIAGEKP